MNVNKAILIGRVGKDPELSYTKTNKAICKFSLAINEKWDGGEKTTWLDITAWGTTAERIKEMLHKSDLCYVEGRIDCNEWENKEGQKQRTYGITVVMWHKLSNSQKKEEPQAPPEDDDMPF